MGPRFLTPPNPPSPRPCLDEHSEQIYSFVQRSHGTLSYALIRSHFLLKFTNQVPSLCLLPCFAAKLRPFLTVALPGFDHYPEKNISRLAMSTFIKISTGEGSPYFEPSVLLVSLCDR